MKVFFFFIIISQNNYIFASQYGSITGNIILDPGLDGLNTVTITSDGDLGIGGMSSGNKLHVTGNATVTGNFSGNQIKYRKIFREYQTISTNATLSDASLVLADSSKGSITLILPSPSIEPGLLIRIKKISPTGNVNVRSSDNGIDGYKVWKMNESYSPNLEIVNDGKNWYSIYYDQEIIKSNVIYRSVGPNNISPLESGNVSKFMTITNSIATFSGVALAGNIGVGDAIQYDSDNNSTIDSVCFISERISSNQVIVQTSKGDIVGTVNNETEWSIYRAYSGLAKFMINDENDGLDNLVEDYDGSSIDLVNLNLSLKVACYADAPDNLNPYNYLSVSGLGNILTSKYNTIKIYTPYLSKEVGVSQRHIGNWDSSKYYIQSPKTYGIIRIDTPWVQLEGLQIDMLGNGGSSVDQGVNVDNLASNNESQIIINNNIIKNSGTASTSSSGIELATNNKYLNIVSFNNIIYGFQKGINTNHNGTVLAGTFFYANNTVANCDIGIVNNSYNSTHVSTYKNNLVYNSTTSDYDFASGVLPGITALNNLSSDTTASTENIGTGSKTFTFVNVSSNNFHLAVGDTGATDLGLDLSADSTFSFNTDIDDNQRAGTWDVGADEK